MINTLIDKAAKNIKPTNKNWILQDGSNLELNYWGKIIINYILQNLKISRKWKPLKKKEAENEIIMSKNELIQKSERWVVTNIVNLGTKFVNRIPETLQLISIGTGSLWVWLHCYCYQIRIFFSAAKHLLQLLSCVVLFLTTWLMFRVL